MFKELEFYSHKKIRDCVIHVVGVNEYQGGYWLLYTWFNLDLKGVPTPTTGVVTSVFLSDEESKMWTKYERGVDNA